MNGLDTVVQRYKNNWGGFWLEHRVLIYLLIIAGSLDAMSTIYFMNIVGPEVELHPLVRWLSIHLGIIAGPIIGIAIKIYTGLLALVYFKNLAKLLLFLGIVFYTTAAILNFSNF